MQAVGRWAVGDRTGMDFATKPRESEAGCRAAPPLPPVGPLILGRSIKIAFAASPARYSRPVDTSATLGDRSRSQRGPSHG